MRNYILLVFSLLILFTACQSNAPEEVEEVVTTDIQDKIPGTWEITHLKVEVDSYQNQDSSFVLEIRENQWGRIFSLRPYRTFFAQDSTYSIVRRNVDGIEIGEDKGLWRSFGDTLMMIQPDAVFQYKVEIEAGTAKWGGVIDWDFDGVEDDVYYASFRFVGKTRNQ